MLRGIGWGGIGIGDGIIKMGDGDGDLEGGGLDCG